MLIGGEKILETATKILNNIEHSDSNELVEVDEVMVVVVTHYGSDSENETETSNLFYRCTSGRKHIQFGILHQANRAVEHNVKRKED